LEVEKKYYADGEDAYSMKRELSDLIEQFEREKEQRIALKNARRVKEGKKDGYIDINEIEKKVKEMELEKAKN
jgi:hypothetical protein